MLVVPCIVNQFQKNFQQDDSLVQYFIISCKSLYMFRVKHSPIIRSSIRLYLQRLVLKNRVWPAVVVDESCCNFFGTQYLLPHLHILNTTGMSQLKIMKEVYCGHGMWKKNSAGSFPVAEYGVRYSGSLSLRIAI
jgi:hypothetical protein